MHPISGHYHPVPLRIDFDCQLPFVLGGCKQNIKVQIQCKYKKKEKTSSIKKNISDFVTIEFYNDVGFQIYLKCQCKHRMGHAV
jgi:hypothetical protein